MLKFLISTIIISALAVAGGVRYLTQKNSQAPKEADVGVGVVGKPSIPKPSQVADPTANWQVYRNVQWGFELKYPSFWELTPEIQGEEGRRIGFYHNDYDGNKYFDVIVIQGYTIFSYKDNRNLEFNEIVKSTELFALSNSNFTKEYQLLGGRPAVTISYMEWIARRKEWCWIKTVLEKTESFNIDLIVCDKNKNKNKEDIDILNQILSSFRFTK